MVRIPTRIPLTLVVALALLGTTTASAQKNGETDFSDRQAVLQTIENFYIGDHTGSTEHKKLSMHPEGAYRYVDKSGKYRESQFRVDSDDSDDQYTEELLGVDIYENVALARLRLKQNSRDVAEYKLMTLHRVEGKWLITSISWGFGVTP